jgi:hypothetical protein
MGQYVFMRRHFLAHAVKPVQPPDGQRPACPAIDWRAVRTADRACCCPARPAIVAVIPPAAGRDHPTDLLLCGHHYRLSRSSLAAAGAAVFDCTGPPDGEPEPPPTAALMTEGEQ